MCLLSLQTSLPTRSLLISSRHVLHRGDCFVRRSHACLHTHLLQQAMDKVFSELLTKDNLSTFGFVIMILNLLKVLQMTRAHPRVGVLVATVMMGIDDIFHFAILFLIVFVTFAMTGTWAFGKNSEDFATFQKGMTTQFDLLNGEFPEARTHMLL